MTDVSDESSITSEWLESILQLYYSSHGRELLDGPPREDEDDDQEEEETKPGITETVTVKNFTVKPGCEGGENLLSDLLAIDVQLERNGQQVVELHLMAKLLSQDPFCRHFILEAGFDVREIHFYTTLMPVLKDFCRAAADAKEEWPVPPCYYAKYRQGSDSVLVLDNMKASGFRMVDFRDGLSLDQAIAAVESMARLHASALAYRLKLDVDLPQAFPFLFRPEAAAESYQQLLERGLPQLATFLHTAGTSDGESPSQLHAVLAKLHKLRPKARETIANLLRPTSPIATLTHTDFWCNNLLFRQRSAGQTECCILDWQMATYSRPTNDLALLLVTSVSGEIRRKDTGRILDAYWRRFLSTAEDLGLQVESSLSYSRQELEQEYERSLLLAVLLGIGSVDLAIGHEATEKRLCEVLVDLSEDKVF